MNIDNIIEYIKSGLGIAPEKKQFRMLVSAPFIMTLTMGLIPGIVLGGYQLILSIMMMITALIMTIAVFILSNQKFTVKNRLILQILIYSNWILQISFLELMYFSIMFPYSIFLYLIYIPPILIPLLLGINAAKKIKKDTLFPSKKILHSGVRVSLIMSGIIGMNFAAIFRNTSQKTAYIVVLTCCAIITSFLSIGLLSIQRLYYLLKLEKLELLPEEFKSEKIVKEKEIPKLK